MLRVHSRRVGLWSDVVAIGRRYFVPIIICATLGGVLGFGASGFVAERYTSTATVLISPSSTTPVEAFARGAGDVDLETETAIAESRRVAAIANAVLGGDAPAGADGTPQGTLRAHALENSRVMELAFDAATPEEARRGAQAFTVAYVDERERISGDQRRVAEERLTATITEIERALALAGARDADGSDRGNEQETLGDQLAVSRRALAELRAASAHVVTVVDEAATPTTPSTLTSTDLAAGGGALGAAAGLTVVLLADAARRRPVTNPRPRTALSGRATTEIASFDALARCQGAVIVVDDDGGSSTQVGLALARALGRRGAAALLVELATGDPDLSQLLDDEAGQSARSSMDPGIDGPWVRAVRHEGRNLDPPSIAKLYGIVSDHYRTVVLIGGRAIGAPVLRAPLPDAGVILATAGSPDRWSVDPGQLAAVEASPHRLIGVVSVNDVPFERS